MVINSGEAVHSFNSATYATVAIKIPNMKAISAILFIRDSFVKDSHESVRRYTGKLAQNVFTHYNNRSNREIVQVGLTYPNLCNYLIIIVYK